LWGEKSSKSFGPSPTQPASLTLSWGVESTDVLMYSLATKYQVGSLASLHAFSLLSWQSFLLCSLQAWPFSESHQLVPSSF
jgi:hypothetical protein